MSNLEIGHVCKHKRLINSSCGLCLSFFLSDIKFWLRSREKRITKVVSLIHFQYKLEKVNSNLNSASVQRYYFLFCYKEIPYCSCFIFIISLIYLFCIQQNHINQDLVLNNLRVCMVCISMDFITISHVWSRVCCRVSVKDVWNQSCL